LRLINTVLNSIGQLYWPTLLTSMALQWNRTRMPMYGTDD